MQILVNTDKSQITLSLRDNSNAASFELTKKEAVKLISMLTTAIAADKAFAGGHDLSKPSEDCPRCAQLKAVRNTGFNTRNDINCSADGTPLSG